MGDVINGPDSPGARYEGVPDGLEILPVRGMGDVTAGDDLAELITNSAPWLRDGDVLVVTSKIVSKAEGRLVEVPADGPERDTAREEVLASETARVVARRGQTAIVQTHHGFVMAAAGIDASNVDKTHLVLLPADPDASARRLHTDLRARGLNVGVIISDTMGRTWRNGLTDVALGAAGIEPFRDHRGEIDPYGNELQLTQMAVIDELAGAGELVKGKCDQVPVAVVRGYPGTGQSEGAGAAALVRDAASDMFSLGTAEARAAGLRDAATLPDALPAGPILPAAVELPLAMPGGPVPPAVVEERPLAQPGGPISPVVEPPLAQPGGPISPEAVERPLAQPGGPISPEAVERPLAAPGGPISPEAVERALALVADVVAPGTTVIPANVLPDNGATAALRLTLPGLTPLTDPTLPGATAGALIRLGADAQRLRAALAAEGVSSVLLTDDSGVLLALSAE